ncbi:hypothetical protein PFISCL1PPCAC_9752, partial [Pristionchus fissidentatus]
MEIVGSDFSCTSSVWNINNICLHSCPQSEDSIVSKTTNHGLCGTPSPPGLTASTYQVMRMKMIPSTCYIDHKHDHHVSESERLIWCNSIEEFPPVEAT